jgi:hypothetical protein
MAHFAQLNQNNIVSQVIVVNNDDCVNEQGQEDEEVGIFFCKSLFGASTRWRQTSYSGSIRKNFAGVGFVYDVQRDAFIAPKPYPSWVLDDTTCQWVAPVPAPENGAFVWDEDAQTWIEAETV